MHMHMQSFPITRTEALELALAHLRLLLPQFANRI